MALAAMVLNIAQKTTGEQESSKEASVEVKEQVSARAQETTTTTTTTTTDLKVATTQPRQGAATGGQMKGVGNGCNSLRPWIGDKLYSIAFYGKLPEEPSTQDRSMKATEEKKPRALETSMPQDPMPAESQRSVE